MKRIICALLCLIFAFFLIGCGTKMNRVESNTKPEKASEFILVEGDAWSLYAIVYHRDTKVMYAVSKGTYNGGNFTLLVNPDGTPMLWNGEENAK